MLQWQNIGQNQESALGRYLSGSSAMLNSLPAVQQNQQVNDLAKKGIYQAEQSVLPYDDNGALAQAIASRDALERTRIEQQGTSSPYAPMANYSGEFSGKMNDTQSVFYDTLTKNGLSKNQALAVMMNVQAENDFMDKYLFGSHQDGQKRAHGALSWQGGREIPLIAQLKAEGLIQNGQIVKSPRVVELQAKHFINELNGREKISSMSFRNNVDGDPFELARLLNRRVIRSNQSKEVLEGREKAYRRFWNANNKGK